MKNDAQDTLGFIPPPSIRTPKKSPLEKDVEARLRDRIKAAGGVSWKFVSPNNRGVSDRVALINGRTIYIEVKRDGGKMSALQKSFAEKITINGGEYALVEGMQGVDDFIKTIRDEAQWWHTHVQPLRELLTSFNFSIKFK